MKIYIAGSYTGRERIKKESEPLTKLHVVLSRWFDDNDILEKNWDFEDPERYNGRLAEVLAIQDIHGVMEADLFIIDTQEPSTTGGRNVELGAALILNLQKKLGVVHIGPNDNLFLNLVRTHFKDWNDFYAKMGPVLGIQNRTSQILIPQPEVRIGRG